MKRENFGLKIVVRLRVTQKLCNPLILFLIFLSQFDIKSPINSLPSPIDIVKICEIQTCANITRCPSSNEFLGELYIPSNSSERAFDRPAGARAGPAGPGPGPGPSPGAGPSEPRLSQDESGHNSNSQHHSSSSSDSSGD